MIPIGVRVMFHVFVAVIVMMLAVLAGVMAGPAGQATVRVKPGDMVTVIGDCDLVDWAVIGVATDTVSPSLCQGESLYDQATLFRSWDGGYVGVLHFPK